MTLDIKNWRHFFLTDIFSVEGTQTTSLDELESFGTGSYPYVSTQATNNGVAGFYDYWTEQGNVLTVDSAVTGFCSYHAEPFSASDHVEKLVPLFPMTESVGLFLATIINLQQYKFSYGRKASQKKLRTERIRLPVCADGTPDFTFMESYIKELHHKPVTTSVKGKPAELETRSWRPFTLGELFDFKKGRRLTKADMVPGTINFLGAISENNGVREKIDTEEVWEANCITVNYNGSVEEPFWASDDVNALYAKGWRMNKYIALFVCTVIKQERYRFSYGRKWTLEKMNESVIKLPVTLDGKPDWNFMESYIKSLPYSDRI